MNNRWHPVIICAVAFCLAAGSLTAGDSYERKDGRWVKIAKPAEGSAAGELALVRHYLDGARYKKAVKAAKKFIKRYPDDDAYEEVCLLAGQAEIKRARYYQAYGWFEKQLDQFPAGRYSGRALQREYEIAEAFLGGAKRIVLGFMKLKATDEGLEILGRIAEHAPGTEIASRSLLRIADYHYGKGHWMDAVEAYDTFLTLFGKSVKAPYAMLQSARANYSAFRGLEFEDTPLLEAEHRFKAFAEAYPAAAAKAGVDRTLERITGIRAQKLYLTAEFYERTKRPPAAAFYYKQVAEEFAQTQWAKDARRALARLGGVKPKEPDQAPAISIRPAPVADRAGANKPHKPQPVRRPRPDRPGPAGTTAPATGPVYLETITETPSKGNAKK